MANGEGNLTAEEQALLTEFTSTGVDPSFDAAPVVPTFDNVEFSGISDPTLGSSDINLRAGTAIPSIPPAADAAGFSFEDFLGRSLDTARNIVGGAADFVGSGVGALLGLGSDEPEKTSGKILSEFSKSRDNGIVQTDAGADASETAQAALAMEILNSMKGDRGMSRGDIITALLGLGTLAFQFQAQDLAKKESRRNRQFQRKELERRTESEKELLLTRLESEERLFEKKIESQTAPAGPAVSIGGQNAFVG